MKNIMLGLIEPLMYNSGMNINQQEIEQFKTIIWLYYKTYARRFAWRYTDDPYHILISEVMLQQTQTHRVEKKYIEFITLFPTMHDLAKSSSGQLFTCWQGLGYNRRALFLQKTAQKITAEYDGKVPQSPEILVTFPAIGKTTAASICAFAFNQPTIFIETNIRAVFIHFFFFHETQVHDTQLYPLVQASIDKNNPREWYYALMDYGVMLKKIMKNPAQKSAHYTKQSKFNGSDRQVRGQIIKILAQYKEIRINDLVLLLQKNISCTQSRTYRIMQDLDKEGFVIISNDWIYFK